MNRGWYAILFSSLLLVSASSMATVPVAVAEGLHSAIGYSDGRLQGTLAPLYRCVLNRVDLEPKFVQVPIKRGLGYLRSGSVTMVLPLAKSKARDEIGEFAGELFSSEYVFVSNKELPSISEASNLRYGIPRGFVGRQFIPETDPLIEEVTDWPQLVAMLRHGRLDAVVLPALMVDDLFGADVVNIFEQTAGVLPISLYLSTQLLAKEEVTKVKSAVENCGTSDLISDLK